MGYVHTTRQYFGRLNDMPSKLGEGSIYVAVDTKQFFFYDTDNNPIEGGGVDDGLTEAEVIALLASGDIETIVASIKMTAPEFETSGASLFLSQRVVLKAFGSGLNTVDAIAEEESLKLKIPFTSAGSSHPILPVLGPEFDSVIFPLDSEVNPLASVEINSIGTEDVITRTIRIKLQDAGKPMKFRTQANNGDNTFDLFGTSDDPYLYFTSVAGINEIVLESPIPTTLMVLYKTTIATVDGSPTNLIGATIPADVILGESFPIRFVAWLSAIRWPYSEKDIDLSDIDETTGEKKMTAAERTKLAGLGGGTGLHADTHEDGGADEIDVTDLSGLLADPQTSASHTHPSSDVTDFDTEVSNNSAVAANTAKVSNIAHPLVETAVPAGAVFIDTVYDDTDIQDEVDLNTAKVSYPGPQDISGKQDVLAEGEFIDGDKTKLDGITSGAQPPQDISGKQDVLTEGEFVDGDKTKLDNQSGTNTGDQDLSGKADKSNVLELDNTDAFTPDADYEPATKKYVDDNGVDISGKADRDGDDLTDTDINGVRLKTNQGVFKFLDGNGDYNIPGGQQYAELYNDVQGTQKLKNTDEVIEFSVIGLYNGLVPFAASNKITIPSNGHYNIQYEGSAIFKRDYTYNFWIGLNGSSGEAIGCVLIADDNMCHSFSFGRILSLLSGDEITIIGQSDSSTDKDWKHQIGARLIITKLS